MKRYAIVWHARNRRHVEAYMPDNYRVIHEALGWQLTDGIPTEVYVIAGEDVAGWTLDGYIIPRLQSGNFVAEEIDLSHPIMKEVPANV